MTNGLFDVLSLQGVSFPSSNVTSGATAGFETKEGKTAAYIALTSATFDTSAYFSLILNAASVEVTAAQAKKLPGVTAGEKLTATVEMYASSVAAGLTPTVEFVFFDEDGAVVGSTLALESTVAGEWEQKKGTVTVPVGATRVNVYLRVRVETGAPLQLWAANLKLSR